MSTILRFPRPKGLTHQALALRSNQIKRKDFVKTIVRYYHNNYLLYPNPKAHSNGTQSSTQNKEINTNYKKASKSQEPTNTKEDIRNKENKRTNYIAEGGQELRPITIEQLASFVEVPLHRIRTYILNALASEGHGLLRNVDRKAELDRSRDIFKALKNKSLDKAQGVTDWKIELLHETRARNYPAGLVKEVTSAMSLEHTITKDTLNLLAHEIQSLEKALNHDSNGYPTILEDRYPTDHTLPVHNQGHMLTVDKALMLLEEANQSGLPAVNLPDLQSRYLTDPTIPNVVANQSDAQGVLKATINLNPPDTVIDHENRREITEGFEVISGTEDTE